MKQSHRHRIGSHILAAAVASVAVAAVAGSTAIAQDAFIRYYTAPGAIGGFSPVGFDRFYQANFSPNQGFTRWDLSGSTWSGTVLVTPTDIQTFNQSSSVEGSGTLPTLPSGGASTIGDIVLNPTEITITRSGVPTVYPAGTIGFIMDQAATVNSGATPRYDLTKGAYWFDLRQVGGGAGTGIDRNGDGTAQWNDVFEPIFSRGDMRTAISYTGTNNATTSRRPAFSTDGQNIYFTDSQTTFGGLWKASLTSPGQVQQLVAGPTGINTEPAVVASTIRAFPNNHGAGSGDQVVFTGQSDVAGNANAGGVSYVVDNGTSVSGPRTLLSSKQVLNYFERSTAMNLQSVAGDSTGNLYFYEQGEGGVTKYDTEGNLVKLFSRAQQIGWDTTSVANGGGGSTNSVATLFDLKVRAASFTGPGGTFAVDQLLVSDSSNNMRSPMGVYLFKAGDFDRDDDVDITDAAALKARLALRGVSNVSMLTATPFTQTNGGDFKLDLNGSIAGTGVNRAVIDWKDVKIFQAVSGMSAGDVDMDFDVDATDLSTLASNYGGTAKLYSQGNLTSVRIANADKDDVNFADLVTLAAGWTGGKPELGTIGSIPQADLDRAFAISAEGAISEYKGKGSGTWSAAVNWSNGVPNAAGAVASLLTKTQDDSTITVDANYTVGQLNFDHAFTYTVGGTGTLTLQGAGGKNAEINTFAASPVINAPLALGAGETDVTVTYTVDTLTVAGGVSGAGSLNKRGAGKVLLQSNVATSGDLDVEAGVVEVATGGGSNRLVRVNNISVAGGSKLDLKDNKLIVDGGDIGTTSGGIYGGVTGLIQTARNGGAWNGSGITTSLPAAVTGLTSLGVTTAAQSGRTTFAGASVSGDDVLVMYTYAGDANLDGLISGDDYSAIDFAIAVPGASGWGNGDFNYDGIISGDDYSAIDFNIVAQGTPFPTSGAAGLSGVAAVPEPSGVMLGAVAAVLTASSRVRRRRR